MSAPYDYNNEQADNSVLQTTNKTTYAVDGSKIRASALNENAPTFVITQGFGSEIDAYFDNPDDMLGAIQQYLDHRNMPGNIVFWDWSGDSGDNVLDYTGYTSTANNGATVWKTPVKDGAKQAATGISNMLQDFQNSHNIDASQVTLIGHSLGAHIMGRAAADYKSATGNTIANIIGVDPADPLNLMPWLDSSDATNVTVLHTSEMGNQDQLGDLDIYVDKNSDGSYSAGVTYRDGMGTKVLDNSLGITLDWYNHNNANNLLEDLFEGVAYEQSDGSLFDINDILNPFERAGVLNFKTSDNTRLYGADGTSSTDDILTGSYNADKLYGRGGNDFIHGRGGNDILSGGSGNDILRGGWGVDELYGGADNDTLRGGGSYDYIDGQAGIDTVDYSNSSSRVTVQLWLEKADSDGNGTHDKLLNIENIVGSNHNDLLAGSAVDNLIEGGGGNDDIWGGAGSDTFTGGQGNDIFRLNSTNGIDTITDFESGDDKIYINASVYGISSLSDVQFAGLDIGNTYYGEIHIGGNGAASFNTEIDIQTDVVLF